jgi:hypothetical protein
VGEEKARPELLCKGRFTTLLSSPPPPPGHGTFPSPLPSPHRPPEAQDRRFHQCREHVEEDDDRPHGAAPPHVNDVPRSEHAAKEVKDRVGDGEEIDKRGAPRKEAVELDEEAHDRDAEGREETLFGRGEG